MEDIGIASTHLVKYSIANMINFYPHEDEGDI